MELHTYGHCNEFVPGMMAHGRSCAEQRPACDSRYRSIIGQLDDMIELIRRQPGRNLTAELGRLLDAMRDHIDSENSFMEMVGYPQAVKHRLHHQFICAITAELRHRFSKGQDVLFDELDYISQTWMEHIHVHDRAFEEFLAA